MAFGCPEQNRLFSHLICSFLNRMLNWMRLLASLILGKNQKGSFVFITAITVFFIPGILLTIDVEGFEFSRIDRQYGL
jgi:hypothetical protein